MIKKIRLDQLRVGMYVHDFNCSWMAHPFLTNRIRVASEAQLEKIASAGLQELYIDTARGLDVEGAPTAAEARAAVETELREAAARPATLRPRIAAGQELARAAQVKQRAHRVVRDAMRDVRLGRAIELDQVEPVVQDITESILRNPGALIGLLQIKNKDDYTFLHSVTVCALVVAFCRARGMDSATMHEAGLGGLLHDVGKARVPDSILNKPGRLTPEEFEVIKRHPQDGYDILQECGTVGEIPLDITLHHHERVDGSGYTKRLPGHHISTLAQMAALVDVYDALTSERCYHAAIPPAEALCRMVEWSKAEYSPELMHAFMRCVGIYPVGTLVHLQSGRLGVVVEAHETELLKPKVNVFFSTRSNTYIRPCMVDLSRPLGSGGGDRIVSHESPQKWRVDPLRFMQLH